ncbi:MAG: redoxin domain-containing protein [Phycisphaerales bacterium JB063]
MPNLLAPLTALACAAVAGTVLLTGSTPALADEPAVIGEAAPGFTLEDIRTAEDVSLSDYEGKVVVLMFHSINCPFYRMAENTGFDRIFVEMVEDYSDEEVVFIGINSNKDESMDRINSYLERHDINYTVLKDEGNVIADTYGAEVTPHVMVIDAEGTLRYRGGVHNTVNDPSQCGEGDEPYLVPVIDALLNGDEVPYTETGVFGCAIKRVG